MAITTSQRLLRRLGGLGRQLFSAQSFATDVTQSGSADLAFVQANSEPTLNVQYWWRTSEQTQQPETRSFAALGVIHNSQPAPLTSLAEHMVHRRYQQIDVEQWYDNAPAPPPQSIDRVTKYAHEEVWLTPRIILTPMREGDKVTSPPGDTTPLRADSVRRKRKHKMNKHKHKKRRKLQRHKN